jgi:hypothetical protein
MKLNRNLLITAVVLFLISIVSYQAGVRRSDRFERGQLLLPNLNPDDVAQIVIAKGDETVTLDRGDDGFTVAEVHGYPATNESVNRVLRALVDLGLEKRVGEGQSLFEELGLTPEAAESVDVALRGSNDEDMVRLIVGKPFEGGSGSYLRRVDGDGGPAFLSSRRASFSTSASSYLDQEIVDVAENEIERIDGRDFSVVRTEDGLKLEGVAVGREEKPSEMNRIKGVLRGVRFEEVFLADDDEVRGLRPQPLLDVRLTDDSGYRLSLAERDGESYLQIAGYHSVTAVNVARDETEEELTDKAQILARADEISRFNEFHGLWVYRISDTTADKIRLAKADLVQKKEG